MQEEDKVNKMLWQFSLMIMNEVATKICESMLQFRSSYTEKGKCQEEAYFENRSISVCG